MREHVGGRTRVEAEDSAGAAEVSKPGKSTLVDSASGDALPRIQLKNVQRKVEGGAGADPSAVHQAAAHGTRGAGAPLPYLDRIQASFGRHDVSHIQAHTDASAGEGARAMGAQAYAMGEHVAFGRSPDLHTAAHEAAHVVQQRAGVHLKGGVGQEGDSYERHADAVADKVVAGESAEELLSTMAPAGGGAAGEGAVQRKLEFASHHAIAPDAAKKAVKADQAAYTQYAEEFELKLGAGLHQHAQAQAGANAMLGRMQAAMTRAGMTKETQHNAFGEAQAKESPDLGVVLVKDVQAALDGGNLREKMGMVYHARFKIAEALDTLRSSKDDDAQDMIGDELKSDKMGKAIEAQKANKKGHASYAILERRNSVNNQKRGMNPTPQTELSEDQLSRENVPLSEREKAAATPGTSGTRDFAPGRQFYVIPPDVRKREQDDLRRVVAGLSGSTDMYFHIAKHLKMPEGERKQLRLAALGQMLVNRDHSYHEIMHEAKTQGELADYPDELPLGYTQLAPLDANGILTTAGVADFPGDAQIREVSSPMETASSIKTAAAPGQKSKSYPAVLELMKAYESNPSKAKLQAVVKGITKWLSKKKPGMTTGTSSKQKYDDRAPHLEKVLKKAKYMLSMWDSFTKQSADERGRRAQRARNTDDGSEDFLNRMGDLEGDHDDWYSPNFRAQTSDMALDTQHIAIQGDEANLGYKDNINTDLKKDTATSVGEVRWELEAINGGDGRNVPDIEPTPGPMGTINPRSRIKTPRQKKKDDLQSTAQGKAQLQKDPQDFQNLDANDIQALAPNSPLGGMLKRFEGKPVPQELEAINAYTQAGFYEMMNHVLNYRADKQFMATQQGQDWWANVPDQTKQLISLAISGLRKMRPYTGSAYRGENMVRGIGAQMSKSKSKRQAHWKSNIPKTKTYNQFVSTSKRPYSSYAVKSGTYTATHITKIKTGVDVSALGGKLEEREILFAPGTQFKVTAVEDRFDPGGTNPADRYGSRGDESPPLDATEPGRIKVTMEEQ